MERRVELARRQAERIEEASAIEAAARAEQDSRESGRAAHGAKLKEWAEEGNGMRKSIRVLLSSLQGVLWPAAHWEPVPMAKLIEPKRVKHAFMKACTLVHPDKQGAMDDGQKYIATQVFHYIESAFRLFQETEAC